jgi:hypothetical protein
VTRRYYSNTARRTTLAADCTDTDISLVISAAIGLPTLYPYDMTLAMDTAAEEIVEVTNRSGPTLTVTRGMYGTTAVAHSAGTTDIAHSFSGEDFEQIYEREWTIAVSDESTALTTGTAKVTFRAPFAMTLTSIPRASLTTASSSGNPTFDINDSGTTILGANKLSIDSGEKTSTTAATATSLADTSIADDAEITVDVDTAGTGATGAKITFYFKKT